MKKNDYNIDTIANFYTARVIFFKYDMKHMIIIVERVLHILLN